MANLTIVSADSHIIEPADLWTARVARPLRERAPKVVRQDFHGRESDVFVAEGLMPFPVSGFAVAGFDPSEFPDRMTRGYAGQAERLGPDAADCRPGARRRGGRGPVPEPGDDAISTRRRGSARRQLRGLQRLDGGILLP